METEPYLFSDRWPAHSGELTVSQETYTTVLKGFEKLYKEYKTGLINKPTTLGEATDRIRIEISYLVTRNILHQFGFLGNVLSIEQRVDREGQ